MVVTGDGVRNSCLGYNSTPWAEMLYVCLARILRVCRTVPGHLLLLFVLGVINLICKSTATTIFKWPCEKMDRTGDSVPIRIAPFFR